jgi:hypothetical protein
VKPRRFSGRIGAVDGTFTKVLRHDMEPLQDWVRLGPARKVISFTTTTKRGLDGFSFRSNAKVLRLNLLIDGNALTERIFVGKAGKHPPKLPFTVRNLPYTP